MTKNLKKILIGGLAIIIIAICIVFKICDNGEVYKLGVEECTISHETKFGGVYIEVTIDDFNILGFKYGDSVDVKFSNGYELKDIPYYNGYYVDMGEPLLIAYPGYDYIKLAINYGDDIWFKGDLSYNETADISLNERGKYIKIQNARDIHYTDIQGSIPDIVFANFRNVKLGNIKDNILYRSASPVDNSHNRAPVTDKLIKDAHINYIVNLSDSDEDLVSHINKEDFNSPYFLSLYNDKKVIALSMNMNFQDLEFKDKLVRGLTAMANNEGPYLVHCVEGKDRTGFVLIVLESLLGASYTDMVNDYMETYDNYYSITYDTDKERYETIKEKNIDVMLHHIIGDDKKEMLLSKITDYSSYTKKYLLSIGMKEEDINKLIDNLSK